MAESEDATSGHAARDMAREECIEIHQHFRRTCHVAQCKLGNLGWCNLMTTRRERFGVIPDDRGWVGIGSNPTGQSKLLQPPAIGARPGNPTRASGLREWGSR